MPPIASLYGSEIKIDSTSFGLYVFDPARLCVVSLIQKFCVGVGTW